MIFFDITTTAKWHGTSVGISRVENELAKGLPYAEMGKFGYCVYDSKTNKYYKIKDRAAQSFLNGKLTISSEDISNFVEFITQNKKTEKKHKK